MIALGTSLFVLMAMVSLQANALFMGPFGRTIAGMVYGVAGFGSYVLVILATAAAVRSLMGKETVMPWDVGVGVGLGVLSMGVLLHLVAARYRVAGFGPGGATGEHLAEIMRALISTAGTALLAVLSLAIAIIIATPLRMRQVLGWIAAGLNVVWSGIADGATAAARFVVDVLRAIMPERREYEDEIEDEDPLAVDENELDGPPIIDRAAPTADFVGDTEKTSALDEDEEKAKKPRKKKSEQITAESELPPAAEIVAIESAKDAKDKGKKKKPEAVIVEEAPAVVAPVAPVAIVPPQPPVEGGAPLIVESRFKHADKAEMAAKEKQAEAERGFIKLGDGAYQLPGIALLNYDAATQNQIDKTYMLELSARLTKTLENYGVKGDVVAIRPGPVVTMYEFAPAPGTRVAKIS
ncbi:MAG TPA: DNA translocase FtsK 4TM domain-containing protein, partial [Kofleriaceae bacterium]|nr:DNA translocase FtsK 4TM domain-containing protein [Kofleriaceae bacterium]